MAGLWEPVSGVFWSAPPPVVVPDEGLSVYWFIVSALVVATVVVAGMWHNARKAEPVKWNLRNHLGKVGSAMTYAYLVVIVAMVWGRSGQLLNMPLNEVGDFLAGAFGPVAFLWLVLGFLQQGDELRTSSKALELQATELKNSVEQQSIMAAAATEQIEAQHAALELQRYERDRAVMANFAIYTVSSAGHPPGMQLNRLRIVNSGNRATDLCMTFDPAVPSPYIVSIEEIGAGRHADYKLIFRPEKCSREGSAQIAYTDVEGGTRTEFFSYKLDERQVKLVFKKVRQGE